MPDLTLRPRLSESTVPLNIALYGVVPDAPSSAPVAKVYWRWEDEPNMEPQLLGKAVKDHTLAAPFDLQGKTVRLFVVGKGQQSLAGAQQTVFGAVTPNLAAASFDGGTDDVTLTIANNGGSGTIRILRRTGLNAFAEVGSIAAATTTFVDSPPIDGTYDYKLTQDGLSGESNTRSVVVSVGDAGTGAAPSDLALSLTGSTR